MNAQLSNPKRLELPVRYFRFFPGDNPQGEAHKTMTLDPAVTALLLIDVYHAAETAQGKELVNTHWDREFWNIVNQRLVPMLASMRAINLPVIYVFNSSPRIGINQSAFGKRVGESLGFDPTEDFREPDVNSLEFDQGDLIQLFIPSLMKPKPGDYFIRKHTYNGFFETRLDSLLSNLQVRNLIYAGFSEDVCVLLTLANAVFLGYNTILVRDGTLATELPDEVESFKHTQRTTLWIESFLGPTTTAEQVITATARLSLEQS